MGTNPIPAELLSKMTGTRTLQKASFNFSGSRLSPILDHMNASLEQVERPLMTPDEVMRLRPPLKSGDGENEYIIEPGDMLIFVAGHRPIYGKQILYFLDPELAKRAAEPPPVKFSTIDRDGRITRQPELEKTVNVMSPPEILQTSTGKSDDSDTGEQPVSESATVGIERLAVPVVVQPAAVRVRPPSVAVLEDMERAEQVRPPNEHHEHEMEL